MSAKHTPGPWQTMEVGDDIVRLAVADKSGLSVLTVVTEGDAQFAAVYSEADARLIAAAPDLLDALQYLAADFRSVVNSEFATHRYPDPAKNDPAYLKAMAAITKAIG